DALSALHQAIRRTAFRGGVRRDRLFHDRRHEQCREPHGRARWARHHAGGARHGGPRRVRLRERQLGLRRVSGDSRRAARGRAADLLLRPRRRRPRLSVVQHVSGAGLHGGRRRTRDRRGDRRARRHRAPGGRDADHGRGVRARDHLRHPAGGLLQVDGAAHLPHGADLPPFRAQGLGGAQGDRALLDHHAPARARRTRDSQAPMNETRHRPWTAVIVGLGRTGYACAAFLHERGWRLAVTDARRDPPGLAQLTALDAGIPVRLGGLDTSLLDEAVCVVASPGVPLSDPFFVEARRRGLEIVGDIELFALAVDAPVVAITGTNGKSTVTTLVGRMAMRAGLETRVGGNLGEPALDLLAASQREPRRTELYVLELSSFQLEATRSLDLKAAAILNISPDHLDRYASVEEYAAAKARIYARCDTAVV